VLVTRIALWTEAAGAAVLPAPREPIQMLIEAPVQGPLVQSALAARIAKAARSCRGVLLAHTGADQGLLLWAIARRVR
jgi:hypothetical protein